MSFRLNIDGLKTPEPFNTHDEAVKFAEDFFGEPLTFKNVGGRFIASLYKGNVKLEIVKEKE